MGLTVETFITKWQGAEGGQERANYALFLTELCTVLGLSTPDPASAVTEHNDYVFERAVTFHNADGTTSQGRIDLYKRGSFVLEAKQSRLKGGAKEVEGTDGDLFTPDPPSSRRVGRQWDVLMLNARQQAENYARHLPPSHEWPPFIVVCDVGHCFELYADFTGKGRNYTQFPDRQGFRIFLDDLRKQETRDLLVKLWSDPHALDPTRKAARVTREIAERLAAVSKRLEAKSHPPEEVALFLMRCLFTMFAEDIGLLPKEAFKNLLDHCVADPQAFMPMVSELWKQMNAGGFAVAIAAQVRKFNGRLFADARAFPMGREDIGELREAAGKDWKEVDPSIFGTLLEQALDPAERSRLGAHYTPRAYVERLVIAAIIEPLREDWNNVLATVERLRSEGDNREALTAVTAFHAKLCDTRILDPACGTGNFLYVALELMKKLEGEVLDAILSLGGQEALRLESHNVDPHQFLGLEINPRAAAIAELVLWIGYLRWHLRTKGEPPLEPILREFRNIERRDAVLEHDGIAVEEGREVYRNPRRPEWPEADYIVGNPPFVAGQNFREEFGDGYAETLWKINRGISGGADYVMYWWDRAAELLGQKETKLKRFGFVTTNSITQEYSRRVVTRHLRAQIPISLAFAIGNHPWTKASKGAADVRIAMTVAIVGQSAGKLLETIAEENLDSDEPQITFSERYGIINPNLTIGVDITDVIKLKANFGLAHDGVKLHGKGFCISESQAEKLGWRHRQGIEQVIKPYRNGRDLNQSPRGLLVIDLFGIEVDQVRSRFPEIYQHVKLEVKEKIEPDGRKSGRDWNHRASYKKLWWVFGEPRADLRPALVGLSRIVVTVDTSKHRIFQFLSSNVVCDDGIVIVASPESWILGILSSHIHVTYAGAAGGWLGVGDDPRWNKSNVFDPFPFPDPDLDTRAEIAVIAERIDKHRKDVQDAHPDITLTEMYNVLEKVKQIDSASLNPSSRRKPGPTPPRDGTGETRSGPSVDPGLHRDDEGKEGVTLTAREEDIKSRALVLILKEYHEELDRAVARAYGWSPALSDEEILARLVVLNRKRAAEESRGLVRWLRPDYQIPRFGSTQDKLRLEGGEAREPAAPAADKAKPSFPQGAVDQTAAVMAALAAAPAPLAPGELAQFFRQGRRSEARIAATLASLVRTGFIAALDNGARFALRRSA